MRKIRVTRAELKHSRYNPEQIISPHDAKPDFEEFWKQTRNELYSVAPQYRMTLMKEKCSVVKNIVWKITCPIIMEIGLQDETCPPDTNFAAHNLIRSEKNYIVYPEQNTM